MGKHWHAGWKKDCHKRREEKHCDDRKWCHDGGHGWGDNCHEKKWESHCNKW